LKPWSIHTAPMNARTIPPMIPAIRMSEG
jgi:hypothetical protein